MKNVPFYLIRVALLPGCLALSGGIADAGSGANGVAEIVNGEAITFYDIEQTCTTQAAELQKQYQGDELRNKTRALKLKTLDELIDRKLIIGEFRRQGGWMPDAYLDRQIQTAIKTQYGGSEDRFQQVLADYGETLEDYRLSIEENAIIVYMTNENVSKKVTATDPKEAARQHDTLYHAWIDALRKKAYLESVL